MADNNTITMMMLGARRVGKTTLLATMYRELQNMHTKSPFGFGANPDTAVDLQNAYQKIEYLLNDWDASSNVESLLPGTEDTILERQFFVSFQGKKEFDFSFYDYAGGLLNKKETENQNVSAFRALLQKAIVIINIVDGAALVKGSPFYSERVNQPLLMSELLKKALDDEQKHLVLFVITKCEAWMKNEEGRNTLQKAFEEKHKLVLDVIENRPSNNVVAVLMPVKTLGCVEFSEVKNYKVPGSEEVVFTKKANLQFKPQGIDQPLRYALAFALAQKDGTRGFFDTFVRFVTGENAAFQNALNKFVNQRDHYFKQYGNSALLYPANK